MSPTNDKLCHAPVDADANGVPLSQNIALTYTTCNKSVTAKCPTIICSMCGSVRHMACLVNYYAMANGFEKLKNSLLWLAELLVGNFYIACDSCAAIDGKPQLVFPRMQPHGEQNNNILCDIASMKQSVKELNSKIAGLLTCMDSIRDELNKTKSSSLSIAEPTTTLTSNNGGDVKPSIVSQPSNICKCGYQESRVYC